MRYLFTTIFFLTLIFGTATQAQKVEKVFLPELTVVPGGAQTIAQFALTTPQAGMKTTQVSLQITNEDEHLLSFVGLKLNGKQLTTATRQDPSGFITFQTSENNLLAEGENILEVIGLIGLYAKPCESRRLVLLTSLVLDGKETVEPKTSIEGQSVSVRQNAAGSVTPLPFVFPSCITNPGYLYTKDFLVSEVNGGEGLLIETVQVRINGNASSLRNVTLYFAGKPIKAVPQYTKSSDGTWVAEFFRLNLVVPATGTVRLSIHQNNLPGESLDILETSLKIFAIGETSQETAVITYPANPRDTESPRDGTSRTEPTYRTMK